MGLRLRSRSMLRSSGILDSCKPIPFLRFFFFMIDLWDLCGSGDRRHRGNWDPVTLAGNPCDSAIVKDTLKSIQNRQAEEGSSREHSLPITLDHMNSIFAWSKSKWPHDDPPSVEEFKQMSQEERGEITLHLFFRAFMSMCWILWTRYAPVHTSLHLTLGNNSLLAHRGRQFELTHLTRGDIEENIYKGEKNLRIDFMLRKGSRKKRAKGDDELDGRSMSFNKVSNLCIRIPLIYHLLTNSP